MMMEQDFHYLNFLSSAMKELKNTSTKRRELNAKIDLPCEPRHQRISTA
jgi:hypothetical protein